MIKRSYKPKIGSKRARLYEYVLKNPGLTVMQLHKALKQYDDQFMVKFKQSGDDTKEIAEEIIEKLNDRFESNLFKLGNSSKTSFWIYIK